MKLKTAEAKKIKVDDCTQYLNTSISKFEFYRLVNVIIESFLHKLLSFGFKRQEFFLFRIKNNILQKIVFETDYFRGAIRIIFCVQPIFGLKKDIGYNDRVAEFKDFDPNGYRWYLIDEETLESLLLHFEDIMLKKAMPYFETLSSPTKIINNRAKFEKNNDRFNDLILFSALFKGNKALARYYLENKLLELKKDQEVQWSQKQFFYYKTIQKYLKKDDMAQIKKMLKKNKDGFLNYNNLGDKVIRSSAFKMVFLFVVCLALVAMMLYPFLRLFFTGDV
ncbi:MAG: hypothetical protein GF347_04770 [Candidatus Moranbacteria bacterium]|nr:hypothetical protein [Candidatus Moranbacteria bacterium]